MKGKFQAPPPPRIREESHPVFFSESKKTHPVVHAAAVLPPNFQIKIKTKNFAEQKVSSAKVNVIIIIIIIRTNSIDCNCHALSALPRSVDTRQAGGHD